MERPFAILEKAISSNDANGNNADPDATDFIQSQNTTIADRTVLDSTIAIEHKSKTATEYQVRAIVKKRLIFKTRPKPIIANVAKKV